jgi:eukaryotic-like serine/threonine-protein kinase
VGAVPALATDESLIGAVFADKYRIVRLIGKGGMGIVFEAEHKVLGKRVAIKLMLDKYFEDGEAKARFQREAVAASRIGNPHIIDVIDIGSLPDGRLYVVMELLSGRPLADVIERGGQMPPWRAISIMRQVLRAVGAAHTKGIIHRDLKPDNIFLIDQGDSQDFVKLLDFGISKVLDPNEQIAFTKLTSTGVVMGTPLYMAPEQAMGQPAGAGADIYACGVMLYEMLAGRTPFVGQTYAVLVAQLLTAPPEPLQNLRPGLNAALVNAVHKALEKEPARRFASAEMFAASLPGDRTVSQIELAGTLDSGVAVPRMTATTQRRPKGRGTILAVGGALVLGVATAAVLIVTQTGAEKAPARDKAKVEPKAELPKPEPKVEPKVEASAITGVLKITSVPDHAVVFVDGDKLGPAPCEITLPPGKHRLRFELAGYDVFETETDVDAGSNRFAGTLVLKKTASAGGKSGPRPTGTLTKLPPTPAGITVPVGKTVPVPAGKSDQPPSGPVNPPRVDPEPRKPPEVKPPDNGKTNPYVKGNPYTKSGG